MMILILLAYMLSIEQRQIVESSGDARVIASAGTGKTWTLTHYAKKRDTDKKLYIVYNSSARKDAIDRFDKLGVQNINIVTTHSLAYAKFGSLYKDTLSPNISLTSIFDYLQLDNKNEDSWIIAKHIQLALNRYCTSAYYDLQSFFDKYEYFGKEEAYLIFNNNKNKIYDYLCKIWNAIDTKLIECSHDFYLKKFHLSKPTLNYDYILADEQQDSPDLVLDLLTRQQSTKVLIGDPNQSLYAFRGAVDALKKVNYPLYYLSESFRFGQAVADESSRILEMKKLIDPKFELDFELKGLGKSTAKQSKAVIARANGTLLGIALDKLFKDDTLKLYFEGGKIDQYLFTDDNISLWDILSAWRGQFEKARSPIIQKLKTKQELFTLEKKLDDASFSRLLTIVKKYQTNLYSLMRQLNGSLIHDRSKADFIFTTANKSKGLEYDVVQLAGDFITEEKIEEHMRNIANPDILHYKHTKESLITEINLLYVAATRAKTQLI